MEARLEITRCLPLALGLQANGRNSTPAAAPAPSKYVPDVSVIEQLMTRRKGLLERMRAAELSLKDISEHQMFLSALEADLLQQRTELERKHRITEAMLKKAQGSAAGALEAKMEALRRWESAFNEKVHLLQKERAWFHRQPAFKQATPAPCPHSPLRLRHHRHRHRLHRLRHRHRHHHRRHLRRLSASEHPPATMWCKERPYSIAGVQARRPRSEDRAV